MRSKTSGLESARILVDVYDLRNTQKNGNAVRTFLGLVRGIGDREHGLPRFESNNLDESRHHTLPAGL
jgi:hypothetical protein